MVDRTLRQRVVNTLQSPARFQRVYHFFLAKALFALPSSVRRRMFAGRDHFCSVCGNHVRRFLALHRPYHAWCPICRSLQRHRLVWLCLQRLTSLFDAQPKRMLHFAPEPGLAGRFERLPQIRYVSADLYDPEAKVRADIAEVPFAANAFDVVYCSHVLEHVPDDRKAIGELHRVLAPGGIAVVLVPLSGEVTVEDSTVTSASERERLFGQHDHLRLYGRDFGQRLKAVGFAVSRVTTEDLVGADDVRRLGLEANETIFLCTKPHEWHARPQGEARA